MLSIKKVTIKEINKPGGLSFGQRLKMAIAALAMDNKRFAEFSGLHVSTISRMCNDKQDPGEETLVKLEKVGLSRLWLSTGEGDLLHGKKLKGSPPTVEITPAAERDEALPVTPGQLIETAGGPHLTVPGYVRSFGQVTETDTALPVRADMMADASVAYGPITLMKFIRLGIDKEREEGRIGEAEAEAILHAMESTVDDLYRYRRIFKDA